MPAGLQAPCRHPAGTQQAPGIGRLLPAGTGTHPAGVLNASKHTARLIRAWCPAGKWSLPNHGIVGTQGEYAPAESPRTPVLVKPRSGDYLSCLSSMSGLSTAAAARSTFNP